MATANTESDFENNEFEELIINRTSDSSKGVMRIICCNYMYYFKAGNLFVCKCKKDNGKQCYSSITLDEKWLRVLKVCGKPGNCNKEELIKIHGHKELKPVELLSVYFEKNLMEIKSHLKDLI